MDVANLIAALGFLSFTRDRASRKDERNFRREEEFIPFKLPPLPRQEQGIGQLETQGKPEVSEVTAVSHSLAR